MKIDKSDNKYIYVIVGNNLKRIRKEHNLTQQQLADMIDLTRQYIADAENENRNKHFTIALLGRIADALEIDITEFFK